MRVGVPRHRGPIGKLSLKRSTPLRRAAFKRSAKQTLTRTRMPRKASKQTDFPKSVKDAVTARSGGACEAQTPDCTQKAAIFHHRKGRGKDCSTVDLCLHVCEASHRYIHAHPQESYERGWMVRRNGHS